MKTYNNEFSEYILQISSMSAAEQTFHFSQGLETHARTEAERLELLNLQEAMITASGTEGLFLGSYSSFRLKGS